MNDREGIDGVTPLVKWCPECRSAGVVGIEQDVCPTCDGTGKVADGVVEASQHTNGDHTPLNEVDL